MTSSAAPDAPRRRARMLSLAPWQFRDYLRNVAAVSIILFGLLGTLEIMQLHAMAAATGGNRVFIASAGRMQVQSFLHLLTVYAAVGPIVALSGIISSDRTLGYARFLFAKPVDPVRFYLQSFIVRLIGYLAVGAVLLSVYRQFEPVADMSRIAFGLLLSFVAYGGMVFLASALTKHDGLAVIAFLFLATLAWFKWETVSGVERFIPFLFPPMSQFSALNDWICNLNPTDPKAVAIFPTKWIGWMLSYGITCLVLGCVALRRRALVTA